MNPLTLSPWLAIGVGVLILGLASWIGVDQLRLKTAKAEVANLTTQVATAKADNYSNLGTIASQRAALATWIASASQQLNDAKAAIAVLERVKEANAKTAASLKALEAKDKTLPDCTKLLEIDLAKTCPSHAQALLERSK